MAFTPYPTLANNITNVSQIITYNTNLSLGLWGYGILVMLFGLTFFALNMFEITRRFVVACFVCFVASVFLGSLGAVNYFIAPLFLLALFALWFFLEH